MPRVASLWKYFSDVDKSAFKATCNYCNRILSFRATISNLKKHLKSRHLSVYEEMRSNEKENGDEAIDITSTHSTLDNADEDSDNSKQEDVLWGFFEKISGGKARCVICHAVVGSSRSDLNRHMVKNHPKLIGHVATEEKQSSDNEDEENTFTEVVYLEQDALQDLNLHKSPETTRQYKKLRTTSKRIKKRRRDSSSDEEVIVKRRRSTEDDELTIFLKYIKCLLQKLTKENFNKIQGDIVNLILTAQQQGQVEIVKVLTSVTDSSKVPPKYSITVASRNAKDEEQK